MSTPPDAAAAVAAAAGRVGAFLEARSHSTLLDPEEVTAVFFRGDWLILDRGDLQTLCRYAEDQAPVAPATADAGGEDAPDPAPDRAGEPSRHSRSDPADPGDMSS